MLIKGIVCCARQFSYSKWITQSIQMIFFSASPLLTQGTWHFTGIHFYSKYSFSQFCFSMFYFQLNKKKKKKVYLLSVIFKYSISLYVCTTYPYGMTAETSPYLLCALCHTHKPQDGNACNQNSQVQVLGCGCTTYNTDKCWECKRKLT